MGGPGERAAGTGHSGESALRASGAQRRGGLIAALMPSFWVSTRHRDPFGCGPAQGRALGPLRAACPDRWPICSGRQAKRACGQCNHANRVASHVEELNRIAVFSNSRDAVVVYHDADIASAKTVFGLIAREDHVAVRVKRHRIYLGYMVINRGASVPVSICQIEQKGIDLPLGVTIGPSISYVTL